MPSMTLNHFAHRLHPKHFDVVVEMLQTQLGFEILRRGKTSIWMRQPGANIDLQFSRSETTNRDQDKRGSQISFLSTTPESDLKELAAWIEARGLKTVVGSWSAKEFFLDLPEAFVDFVIEAMTPDLAVYDKKA